MKFHDEYKGLTKDTQDLIRGQEGREVDFKIKPNGVKPDDFVAFANARGGAILIGVDEEINEIGNQCGKVVGCSISEKVKQGFINSAASCRPSLDITVHVENAGTTKPIYRIDVPEGKNKPYCTNAGLYKMRADGQNIAIDPPLMKAIIIEQEASKFVTRFKAAGDELLEQIDRVHKDLGEQVTQVEQAAKRAERAAKEAGMWAASS
jgi:predicted HTH transcriptional regulator